LLNAAALSFALLAGAPVVAQTQTADAVMAGMAQLGMDTEGLVLTEEQVLQVEAILNDAGPDDSAKVAQINQLLGL
jgi:hypothetical protein